MTALLELARSTSGEASQDAPATAPALGRHLVADLWGVDAEALDDLGRLERLALAAVEATRGTVLGVSAHKFAPQGVTVVVLVAESHLALHSWPEHGYLGFDYFTCGERVDPHAALALVCEALAPRRVESAELARGTRRGI
jgi:S-adenosylmethionine decarboxylase